MELMQRRRELMTFEHGHWATATGSIATFNTPFAKPLRSLKAEFMPVQEGTGDPSPTNVRPITGWTGIEVYKAGKNLLPPAQTDGMHRLFIRQGETVTASSELPDGSNDQVRYYKEDGTQIDYWDLVQAFQSSKRHYRAFSTLSTAGWFKFYLDGNEQQVEFGNVATSYEPYQGTTLPIDWSSAGTVYGGYVDLVTGVLTATHVLVDFKKWTTLGYGAGNGSVWFFSSNYSPALKKYAGGTAANAYCDKLKVDKYYSFSMNNSNDLRIALDSAGRVRFRYNALSGSEHKEDMYAVLYGLSFIAPLDTPITYQLTPQQIATLIGTNNIWSTANGNVTAEYFTR